MRRCRRRIITLDLGTKTGWAAWTAPGTQHGRWTFEKDRFAGGGMRFLRFRQQLTKLIELVKPEVIYFEEVRRHLGTTAAHLYGGFLAMLSALGEERQIPYQGVPVQTIKKFATGKGNASKLAMIAAAKERFPHRVIVDDNEADALCLLAWAMNENLEES